MTGMPFCGPCGCDNPECPLFSELPIIVIEGMHQVGTWMLDSGNCCARICFEYDSLPPLRKRDGGDVMTFDQTKTCTRELFYYPITCGQATQGFWQYHPQHDEFPGLYPQSVRTIDYPEPAYTGYCNDPVSVQTLTITARKRGGIRFLAALRSTGICITLQKVTATCPGEAPVTKYLFTSKQYYSGFYEYFYYDEVSTTYSYGPNYSGCWVPYEDVVEVSGSYPFDLASWDGDSGTAITGVTCRKALLDEMPSSSTVVTFGSGDTLNGCTVSDEPCAACDTTDLCFATGPEGGSEPTPGFCDASTTATIVTNTTVKTCSQHMFYYWSVEDTLVQPCVPVGYPLEFPPNRSRICCQNYSPSNWSAVPSCTKTFSYSEVTGPGITVGCACPEIREDAPESCYPSLTCPTCVGAMFVTQGPAANVNLPVSLPDNTVRYGLECRTIGLTRSVSCSGYMEQEICFSHETVIITVNPLEVIAP